MKLIPNPEPSRETCWQHQTVAFCPPSEMFLISKASPVPCPLSEEQFMLEVLWGRFRTWTYSLQSPLKIAPTVLCSICFPAGPTMALFKCHPSHVGAKLGRSAWCSRRKRRWSNRAWVNGSPLIAKFALGCMGSHSPGSTGAVCQSGKVLDRLCNAYNPVLPLQSDLGHDGIRGQTSASQTSKVLFKTNKMEKINVNWSMFWAVDWGTFACSMTPVWVFGFEVVFTKSKIHRP